MDCGMNNTKVSFNLGVNSTMVHEDEDQKGLLDSPILELQTPVTDGKSITPQTALPTIIVSGSKTSVDKESPQQTKNHFNKKLDHQTSKAASGKYQLFKSISFDSEYGDRNNNANVSSNGECDKSGEQFSSMVTFASTSELPTSRSNHGSLGSINTKPKKTFHKRAALKQLSSENHIQMRKYSLPCALDPVISSAETALPLINDGSAEDLAMKQRHSIFGFGNDEEQIWTETRSTVEAGFKNHLFSFFQASDNKLAMKLFGSRTAVLKEKQRQFNAHTWIIHPCSNFRLYWDLLMLIFLVTNLVVLPVAIAFFFNDVGSHWMVFNITCDILFILDIAINFRTGLIDSESHGEVILDGKVIAIRYLKGWFVVDFFSSLPLDYMFLALEGELYAAGRAIKILRLAKILQLLRLLRISRLVRYIRLWQEYFSIATIVVRIFNLICVMVLLSHWSGCIQFAIPVFQGWPEDSWISMENLQEAHWWDQYTRSLFKALSHMLCIGYGQYPPRNVTETWLTILSMLAGASCYALFVGHTTALIQSFDSSSRQFRDHLQQVNEYMAFRKLPTDLRQRIVTYYDHRYGGKMFNEHDILSELSDKLRNDILSFNCKELIQTVPFFVNADPNFVDEVITKLEFEMFQTGDVIIKAGTKGTKMYFIQEGVVEVVDEEDRIVTRLADGSYFGEISLLTGQNRTASVRAAHYCNLFSLKKDDFDQILSIYPLMKRTLETIAAQRLNHLGKDPAMLSSRESLLEEVDVFKRAINVNIDEHSDDEEGLAHTADDAEDNQFLSVVKGFFTKDSESFNPRKTSRLSRSPSPLPRNNNNNMKKCKSNLHYLIAPRVIPLARRSQSSADLPQEMKTSLQTPSPTNCQLTTSTSTSAFRSQQNIARKRSQSDNLEDSGGKEPRKSSHVHWKEPD